MENNNLVTYKLANLYYVINADSTPNKVGYITEYIWAYVEIGLHRTTQYLFVTNLENKEMMIGYLYLYKHNLFHCFNYFVIPYSWLSYFL